MERNGQPFLFSLAMKTTILQLESHDTLISIRDRMDWAKTPRILLVWPRQGRLALKPVELTLLQRHATGLGAQLGLVVTQWDLRRTAKAMGLPVFKQVADAQRSAWEGKSPAGLKPIPESHQRVDVRAIRAALPGDPFGGLTPARRLGIFSAGVLAMLLVVLAFMPSAEIRIRPPEQTQQITIPVTASPGVLRVSIAGEIPVQSLTVTVEGSDFIKATGQVTVPSQAAQAVVTLTNITGQDVFVPAGTILLTSGVSPAVRFAVMQDITIEVEQTARVNVQAVNAGASGNVPVGTIVAFEGPLGLQLTARNLEDAQGGTDMIRPAPTANDQRKLRQALEQELLLKARQQVEALLRPGDVLIPTSLRVVNVLSETITPVEGQPALEATLALRLEIQADFVSALALQQLAELGMDATLPAGYAPVPGSLSIDPASSVFTNDEGVARWQLTASRMLRRQINPAEVISLSLGKTVHAAAGVLQQTYGLETTPEIGMMPPGWPWLPWLPVQIRVVTP